MDNLITFETAKSANIKGFIGRNLYIDTHKAPKANYYTKDIGELDGDVLRSDDNDKLYFEKVINAPTQAELQDWLLTEHNLWVELTLWEHGWHVSVKEKGEYIDSLWNVAKYGEDKFKQMELGLQAALNLIK